MQNNTLKLLIKFPTRGRPEKFFSVLDQYIEKANDLSKIAFLISMDADDSTMNNNIIISRLESYKNKIKIVYFFGQSKSKIQAVNADMEKVQGWDIVLLASDDMVPVVKGYDHVIRSDMNEYFRDTDGVLWYADGGQSNINTLSIIGKAFYNRFGYIYNPEYVSLWCDNEFTDVSRILKRTYKSDKIIIEHQHPVYQKTEYDELYMKNESYYNVDKETYMRRSAKNFDLDMKTPIFSILTPSVPERSSNIEKLYKKLASQIGNKNIEHITLIDNKKRSIGAKREDLVSLARGKYLAFVDDDDDISDDYVDSIIEATNHSPDVITFKQSCYVNKNPVSIINFSLKNKVNEEYFPNIIINRMPFHVCAWKTELAQKYKFSDKNYSEDWFWAEQLIKEAKTEYHIDKILHSYIYNDDKTTTHISKQ